jgi:imidazole glycerol-phosphate synthase subunit HisF
MLHPRIIPCLLVHKRGLVKTVMFGNPKYVGDPINAVRIFNEKEVDELMVIDIDATVENREPDLKMIQNLAYECRMPLSYGGGISNADQALRIFELGVEKISISSAAVKNPKLISDIAQRVGNQSVVVVLDAKKKLLSSKYEVLTHNGQVKTGLDVVEFAKKAEDLGAGEIVINSIDNDGVMKGYDHKLIDSVRGAISTPLTVLGGAGKLEDIGELIRKHKIIGAAAGSLFVFKGVYKAVLINYPNRKEKESLISNSL